jgi:hypothetical protein
MGLYEMLEEHGDTYIVLRDKKNESADSYCVYEIGSAGMIIRGADHRDAADYFYIEIGDKIEK